MSSYLYRVGVLVEGVTVMTVDFPSREPALDFMEVIVVNADASVNGEISFTFRKVKEEF